MKCCFSLCLSVLPLVREGPGLLFFLSFVRAGRPAFLVVSLSLTLSALSLCPAPGERRASSQRNGGIRTGGGGGGAGSNEKTVWGVEGGCMIVESE